MWQEERKIERRGRAFWARAMRPRTRARRRSKRAFVLFAMAAPLLLLAFLAADGLGVVLDALALVGLRLAVAADDGGDLADALAVGAADRDRGRLLADDLDVVRDRELHLVAVAELQVERLALDGGAIADAVDLEVDGKALRDAVHHVVDERPGGPPERPRPLAVALRLDPHLAVLERHRD